MDKLAVTAERVRTPLSLAAVVVFVLYGVYRLVLSLHVFASIGSKATYQLLASIVDRVFVLALVALVLGFTSYLVPLFAHRKPPVGIELVSATLDPDMTTASPKQHRSPDPSDAAAKHDDD